MEKINIEVCLGTTCFVMGASRLQDLETLIPPRFRNMIVVKTPACLDLCKNAEYMKAPFVKIDDEVISEATIEKIVGVLERKING